MSFLVIVESPTKAKTISKFIGRDFVVKSSFGHLRDLPENKLGVDVERGFTPHYVVSREKSKIVKELRDAAKKAGQVLFATDEDREGEAISWHLAQILDIDPERAERITFHEITKTALEEALKRPRHLDMKMVDAQQARRVLDRLVGYNLSPFLWRKVAKGLSAGRVQSVAVRLIVEREREIQAFKTQEYWTIEGEFAPLIKSKPDVKQKFLARLVRTPVKKLDKLSLPDRETAEAIEKDLANAAYTVENVETKKAVRTPPPPFTTSSLQQEANHALGFSAKQTMRIAQALYEGVALGAGGQVGLITYMRTDAVNLSEKFLTDARAAIEQQFGKNYALPRARFYKNKNKNAQEAHEAIRPAEAARLPNEVKEYLEPAQFKLYDLIWRRAIATQMAAAEIDAAAIDIASANRYGFHATGQTIVFDGFLKLYPDKAKESALPTLPAGESVANLALKPEQHFTEPPARYSDATLVKALEEYGIGRPSTYAPTIATIEERGYVERNEQKKLQPKEIAFLVNDLLVQHFPEIVDYEFTAQMEENLDAIARGEKDWQPIIATFYHPFKENLDKKDAEISKKTLTEEKTDEVCPNCGKPMVIKLGRFGKFLACTGYPECKTTKPLPGEEPAPAAEPANEACEKCGAPMLRRMGRYGPFLGCSAYPKCKNIKNIEIKVNLKCPDCGQGDIVEKRSKRGKIFYACNRYPDCAYALWDKPTGEFCPECGRPLVYKGKKIACSDKECSYKAPGAPPTE